jgi:thiamine-phosphate pyrophosphorylase
VAFLQLRMKDTAEGEVLRMARVLRGITRGTATRLIVNDFPRVAAEVGADGAHVGQGDTPYEQARAVVGPGAIVGLSTHNPEQTRAACALGADYIGVGPVYATPTKKIPDPPLGLDGMAEMLSVATVPAVVLGGITAETLPGVLRAGARNFAMVRPLNQARDPEAVLKRILDTYGEFGHP